jgi:hypothetical protein
MCDQAKHVATVKLRNVIILLESSFKDDAYKLIQNYYKMSKIKKKLSHCQNPSPPSSKYEVIRSTGQLKHVGASLDSKLTHTNNTLGRANGKQSGCTQLLTG